jgi:hypothetical protein
MPYRQSECTVAGTEQPRQGCVPGQQRGYDREPVANGEEQKTPLAYSPIVRKRSHRNRNPSVLRKATFVLTALRNNTPDEWASALQHQQQATMSFVEYRGSRTCLVMRIVYSSRSRVLVSPLREFAMIRATFSSSKVDPVLFLITKQVREPIKWRNRYARGSRRSSTPAAGLQSA